MIQELAILGPFELRETELVATRQFSYDEWQAVLGHLLDHMSLKGHRRWWLGDLVAYGGDWIDRPEWLGQYNWDFIDKSTSTARAIAPERRRTTLSFDHHGAVRTLTPYQQTAWLDKAERDGLTAEQLIAAVKPIGADAFREELEQEAKHWFRVRVTSDSAEPGMDCNGLGSRP
jgi:hypothetical protein